MCEVCGPALQPLRQSYEEDDDAEPGEEDEGVRGKYMNQDQMEYFSILFIRKCQMGIGLTGKTSLMRRVGQQDLFKQDLAQFLVDQGSRVR